MGYRRQVRRTRGEVVQETETGGRVNASVCEPFYAASPPLHNSYYNNFYKRHKYTPG